MAAFLQEGFASGFCVPFSGPRVLTECGNLKSAGDLPVVDKKKMVHI